MSQAHLFRIAAKFDHRPSEAVEAPGVFDSPRAARSSRGASGLTAVAAALVDVEALRAALSDELAATADGAHAASAAVLPQGMCAPSMAPFLSGKARAMCDAFPKRAEAVVRSHGIDAAHFNKAVKRAARDPVYAWRLRRATKTVLRQ